MALSYSKADRMLHDLVYDVYIGLSTTTPTRGGGNVSEPSGNGYARKRLIGMGSAQNGVIRNAETVYFPEATGDWGECTYFCLFGSATEAASTSLVAYGALDAPIHPTDGKVPLIRAGNLQLSM